MAIIRNVLDFHPDHTFDCGQCFRWIREEDGSYTGIAFGKPVNLRAIPSKAGGGRPEDPVDILIDNATQEEADTLWRSYLDLDRDYGRIKEQLAAEDPVMERAIRHGYGIRILNQDRWETILSFLISQYSVRKEGGKLHNKPFHNSSALEGGICVCEWDLCLEI